MKDNSDSGQFLAIQNAGAVALDNPQITEEIAAKYSRRMDLLIEALRGSGFQVTKPNGSFFLYVEAPKSASKDGQTTEFDSGEAFSQWLITNELISTVPWDDCGGFVRFSVTFAADGEAGEEAIVGEIARRLAQYAFSF
jgi:LL-diaminopimelate aminotransferase